MKHVAAIAIAMIACGAAQAQYASYGLPYSRPLPYGQVAPGAPLSPNANARIPDLMPYPEAAPGPIYPVYQQPALPYVSKSARTEDPPATASAGDEDSAAAPPQEYDASALPPVDEIAPEADALPEDAGLPPFADEPTDIVRPRPMKPAAPVPPLPMSPQATSPLLAPQLAVQAAPMVAVPQPPPQAVPMVPAVKQTLLGHYFHLEQMQELWNYSTPVHYPKDQIRGAWWYGDIYFLMLWVRNQSPPPLLLSPTDEVVVGGGTLQFDNQERQGWRLTLGRWLDGSQTTGCELTYMAFAERTPHFVGSDLFRPQPGLFVDIARVNAPSRFWTVEFNHRRELCRSWWGHIDCLYGLRYAELDEALNIATEDVATRESYRTENLIFAAQVGLDAEYIYRYVSFNFWTKLGLANAHQHVGVDSDTLEPVAPAGVSRNQGTAMIETGAFLALHLTSTAKLSLGYTILFFNDLARPDDQIDADPNTFAFGDSSYWIQGLNAGLEFRF